MITKIFIAGNFLLFTGVFMLGCFLFVNYKKNNIKSKLLEIAKANENQRKSYEEEIRIKDGHIEKESMMFRMDVLLDGSGIKRKFHMSSEVYIILQLVLSLIVFIILSISTGSLMLGAGAGLTVPITTYGIVKFLNNLQLKKIEAQTMQFLNLIESYSRQSDDIIYIFGRIYPYLEEPLKTYIYECYVEAVNTGDVDMALDRLEIRIQHKKIQDIIRNIHICSHHSSNYETVIRDSRKSIRQYLAGKEERKALTGSARMEIIIICGLGFLMLKFISDILEMNVIEFLMKSGTAGQALLAYLTVALLTAGVNIINISDTDR